MPPVLSASSSVLGWRVPVPLLAWLRLVIALVEAGLVWIGVSLYALNIPVAGALGVSAVHAVLALSLILRQHRDPPPAPLPAWALASDLLLLGLWLGLTGGHTNPLISLLLLPLALSAAARPLRITAGLSALAVAEYTLLLNWYWPIAPDTGHAHHASGVQGLPNDLINLHLLGMWLTFMLSVALLLGLLAPLMQRLRDQQAQLAQQREAQLRNEQLLALGLSAASTAHRLGTPLNTMTLLVDELRQDPALASAQADFDLLARQLGVCKDTLRHLAETAQQARHPISAPVSAAQLIRRLRDATTLLWPERTFLWPQAPDVQVLADPILDQAILSLVENAIRHGRGEVGIQVDVQDQALRLSIRDGGPGLPDHWQSDHLQPVASQSGLGLGLLLSNASIMRLGGRLSWDKTPQGGILHIHLPILPGT